MPNSEAASAILLRGLGLLALSSLLGLFFASLAASGLGLWHMMPAPAVVGVGLGAIQTPVLWPALQGRGTPLFLFLIVSVTTAVTLVGGWVSEHPAVVIGLSVVAYVGTSLLCAEIRRRMEPQVRPGRCASCGYLLRGLPPSSLCPECGAGAKA